MEKLNELFNLCSASVTIIHDEHKDYYQSVEVFLSDLESLMPISLDADVRKVMVEKNHMITLHAYPDTPIGFYTIYHWDLLAAVDEMLAIVKGPDND